MKKILQTALTILIIVLIVSLLYFIAQERLTGRAIENQYVYTKAICDENNFCQDYEISCSNGEVVKMTPVTGAFIQHSPDWQDPRKNKSEIVCE